MFRGPLNEPLKRLLGTSCAEVTVLSGTLTCEFTPFTLSIESTWRVVGSDLVLGSGSDMDGLQERLRSTLVGSVVVSASATGNLNDLVVETNSGLRIESFADSDVYESWRMAGPMGDLLVAGPGSSWSLFEEGAASG
jgi:hypothetical protein